MKRSAMPSAHIKEEVITIEDDGPASSGQPSSKSVKKEVQPSPLPSPVLTVAELQDQLKKSEEKCQRAIHIAGQHLARAESLQRLVDKKPNISQDARVEELERKVIQLTNELDAERQRGSEDRRRNSELTAHLSRQLEEVRRRGNEGRAVQYESTANVDLRRAREDQARERGRVNILMDELERERRQGQLHANELRRAHEIHLQDRTRIGQMEIEVLKLKEDLAYSRMNHEKDRKKISDLSSQLTWWANQGGQKFHMKGPVLPQQLAVRGPQDPRMQKLQPSAGSGAYDSRIMRSPHPTNILEPLVADSKGCISLDMAHSLLRRGYDNCDMKILQELCLSDKISSFDCLICDRTSISKWGLFKHFFSQRHADKVRATGAGVSKLAVEHWLACLHKVTAAGPMLLQQLKQVRQQQPPAATEDLGTSIATNPHLTNILEPLRADAKGYISLDKALIRLQSGYDNCDMKLLRELCDSDKDALFDCDLCEETVNKWDLFKHVFSLAHVGKMRAAGAGLSELSVKHWLGFLQQATPVAASSAPSSSFGLIENLHWSPVDPLDPSELDEIVHLK